ncbi:MAG TPA: hypothetical protein VMR17_16215 [Xanthobacteraceae bacterium]|nr:hypothetical protein [Xanthobacteraceae bacterium]
MALSVHVASLTPSAAGQFTAVVVIQPSEFSSFRIQIVFDDLGSEESNLHHVQGALAHFSNAFADALKQPLKIVRKPAAKE